MSALWRNHKNSLYAKLEQCLFKKLELPFLWFIFWGVVAWIQIKSLQFWTVHKLWVIRLLRDFLASKSCQFTWNFSQVVLHFTALTGKRTHIIDPKCILVWINVSPVGLWRGWPFVLPDLCHKVLSLAYSSLLSSDLEFKHPCELLSHFYR